MMQEFRRDPKSIHNHQHLPYLEFTRIEVLCFIALVGFLLTGGRWGMLEMEQWVPKPVLEHAELAYPVPGVTRQTVAVEDELHVTPLRLQAERLQTDSRDQDDELEHCINALHKAQLAYQKQRQQSLLALQEGGKFAMLLNSRLEQTRHDYRLCLAQAKAAKATLAITHQQLQNAGAEFHAAQAHAQKVYDKRVAAREWRLFLVRLLYCGLTLVLSWNVWQSRSKAGWHLLSLATAGLTFATLQLLGLLLSYSLQIAQGNEAIVIAVFGSLVCSALLLLLKLVVFNPQRVARARLAARRCPGCAMPFDRGQEYCCGCGQSLLKPCLHCQAPHLDYTTFCSSCGKSVAFASIG